MSFAHVGSLGSASAKAAGATLTMNPSGTVPVGDIVVVFAAWDNDTSVNSDTSQFSINLKCEDTQDNVWCQLHSQQGGGTANHTRAAIYVSRLRTQITNADTITLTSMYAAGVAKAMSVEQFSMDPDFTLARSTFFTLAVDNGADPQSIPISGIQNRPHLILHALAAEGPDTDTYTWDSDYTQISGDGTTGGADDSNQHIRGGWRIATLTSDTINVTSDTADRDYIQAVIVLDEAPTPASFPTEPILDNFNRANENPLDNGDWRTDFIASICNTPPGANTPGFLQVISNEVQVDNLGHVDDTGGSWWATPMSCNEVEAFATITTAPSDSSVPQTVPLPATNGIGRGAGAIIHGIPNYAGCRTGIEAKWEQDTRLTVDDVIRFGDSQFFTVLPYVVAYRTIADGVKIGVSKYAYYAYLWMDEGAGWELVMAVNYQSINNGPHYIGLDLLGSETKVDNFGGGDTGCFTPQIYRRVNT